MKKLKLCFALLITVSLIYAQKTKTKAPNTVADSDPIVRIISGKLRGVTEGDVSSFNNFPGILVDKSVIRIPITQVTIMNFVS